MSRVQVKANGYSQANDQRAKLERVSRATATPRLKNVDTTGLTSAQIDSAVFGSSSVAQPADGLQIIDSVNGLLLTRIGGVWKTKPDWIAPTLINSWANAGSGASTAGYLKDPLGFVHMHGRIGGGSNGSVAFVLPAGYRPGTTGDYSPIVGASGATVVSGLAVVNSTGTVMINSNTGVSYTDVSLINVTFLAEN